MDKTLQYLGFEEEDLGLWRYSWPAHCECENSIAVLVLDDSVVWALNGVRQSVMFSPERFRLLVEQLSECTKLSHL